MDTTVNGISSEPRLIQEILERLKALKSPLISFEAQNGKRIALWYAVACRFVCG
jgi:hypothetical protein